MNFFSPNGKQYDEKEIINVITGFAKSEYELGNEVTLIIGTDSQYCGEEKFVFAVAVAIHSVGYGGRFFIHKEKKNKFLHLADRLFEEVSLSLQVASMLRDNAFVDYIEKIEVHADVGHNGKSGRYANAIKAMIEGYGFTGKIKPDSAVATHIADHYVR